MEPLIKAKFPVSYEVQEKQVLEIVQTWLKEGKNFSRGFASPKEVLEEIINKPSFIWNGLSGAVIQKESVQDENVSYSGLSFKHHGPDANSIFETKVAFRKDNENKNSSVSVVLEYGTSSCFHRIVEMRKPILINKLIEKLPHFCDGWIPIKTEPHFLQSGDEFAVSDLINGINAQNSLPVIYVSRENKTDSPVIDPEELAKKVAGLAHVIVEPDHAFSGDVKKLLKIKELACYDGGVRVYWPGIDKPHWNKLWIRDFLQGETFKPGNRDSTTEILNYIASRDKALTLGDCSFDQIVSLGRKRSINHISGQLEKMRCEVVARDRDHLQLVDIYNKTLKEHKELTDLYETTLNSLESDKSYLEKQVQKLSDELVTSKDDLEVARANMQDVQKFTKHKNENPLADHKEILLAVNSFLKRYGDVIAPYYEQRLTSLLAERGDEVEKVLKEQEEVFNEIASAFNGYTRMSSHHHKILHKHGFAYSEDGSHYKIFKTGFNPDICVTLSKTPSDHRTGKNFAAEMKKTFFEI